MWSPRLRSASAGVDSPPPLPRTAWLSAPGPILDRAVVGAAPEGRLRGRRLPSAPDEDGVAEYDRNGAGLLPEVRVGLHLEVQVRRQRVSRVPDRGDLLADPHALSLAHPRASSLEVRPHGVAPTSNIEDDVVALTGRLPDVADGRVRVDVAHADDRAVRRGGHGPAGA